MNEWFIREAHVDDARAIVEYLKILADEPDNGTSFTSSDQIMSPEDERILIADYAKRTDAAMYVAEVDGAIVALGNVEAFPRMFYPTAALGMSVHIEWRRRGIGRALLREIINFARLHPDIVRLQLEVFTHNLGAIKLYEEFGFQYDGTRRYVGYREGRYIDEHMMSIIFDDKLAEPPARP